MLHQNPVKLGLVVTDNYPLVDVRMRAVPNVDDLGPMLIARYWEAIAVPELRVHARRLASQVLLAAQKQSPLVESHHRPSYIQRPITHPAAAGCVHGCA